MFGVRGVTGEVFRGPLDELLRAHRVLAPEPARTVEQDAGETTLPTFVAPYDEHRHQAATAAYAAAEQPSVDRGPVYHAY